MPFEDDNTPVAPLGPMAAPVGVKRDIAGTALAGAAFRQVSPVGSVLTAMTSEMGIDATPDPTFDAWGEIKDTRYAQYAGAFARAQNRAQFEAIKGRIDQEDRDNQTIADSGGAGIVAALAMGLVDPTILLPGGAIYRSAKGGVSVARTAGVAALAGAAQGAASEAILQGSQITRSPDEWLTSVGTSAILSGILGAGAGALVSKGERVALERALDEIRAPRESGLGAPMAGDVGAAAADVRTGQYTGFGLDKVPYLGKAVEKLSPTLRVGQSVLQESRRILGDLAVLSLDTLDNTRGVTTARGGISVEGEVMLLREKALYNVLPEIDRLYNEYRFGPEGGSMVDRAVNAVQGAVGSETGSLTKAQFNEEVGKAMRRSDVSNVPQVQAAAQKIRKDIIDPLKERAIKAELLPEDVQAKGAASWFARLYNRQKIEAQGPEFTDRVAGWLLSQETEKQTIKGRLESLEMQRAALVNQVERLDARLGTAERQMAALNARAEAQRSIDDLMTRIEKEVAGWNGTSVSDAKSALKAREKYAAETNRAPDAPRLTSADDAVGLAVKRILSRPERTMEDHLARAAEIKDRIISTPDGRMPYDEGGGAGAGFAQNDGMQRSGPRGSLAARDFAIPDEIIEDFLDSDAEQMVKGFLRTFLPDVALKEKFGTTDLTEQFKRIQDEANALERAAKTEAERVAIRDQANADIRDLAAMRDRIRSTYGADIRAKLPGLARAANVARSYNIITSLGTAAFTSIPDLAGTVFRWGLGAATANGWAPYLKALASDASAVKAQRQQFRAMGIGIETWSAGRMQAMEAMNEAYHPHSRLERALDAGTQAFFIANLQAPLTDLAKHVAASVTSAEILRISKLIAEGNASQKDIARLTAATIDPDMAKRIWADFSRPGAGEVIDGVFLPNLDRWQDRDAAKRFEAALMREVNIAVITPGQEKPLFMSNPVLGIFGQFKSFVAGAQERLLLANMQRADFQAVQGAVVMMAAGALSVTATSIASDRPLPERPQDWIKESLERSGLLGWLSEVNQLTAKATSGGADIYRLIGADKPLSRNSATSAAGMLLGPTYSKIETLFKVSGAPFREEGWTARDTADFRRLLPLQNLWALRRALNEAEDGINRSVGIEPLDRERLE